MTILRGHNGVTPQIFFHPIWPNLISTDIEELTEWFEVVWTIVPENHMPHPPPNGGLRILICLGVIYTTKDAQKFNYLSNQAFPLFSLGLS